MATSRWEVVQASDEQGDKVVIGSAAAGSKVEICLFGATVVSWVAMGKERLFLSPLAIFDGKKAIRGGIPLVFPQFGQPDVSMPQHGFARTSRWSFDSAADVETDDSTFCQVRLRLVNTPATEALWPHAFSLCYTVTVTESSLNCELSILNTSTLNEAFRCSALLHAYIRLSRNIRELTAKGFQGLNFIDKLREGKEFEEQDDLVSVVGETDRVYLCSSSPRDIILHEAGEKALTVCDNICKLGDSANLPVDIVFWNAWVDKSKALADLGEGAYESYVCVEPGCVRDFVEVPAGAELSVSTMLVL